MAHKATISGIPLLNTAAVRWTFTEGVRPDINRFEIDPGSEEALKSIGPPIKKDRSGKLTFNPVTLRIEGVDREPLEIKNLFIINFPEGPNPKIKVVELADQRIWWAYRLVKRDFNILKNVGFRRIGDISTPELTDVEPDVNYAKWSIKNPDTAKITKGDLFRAKESTESVLDDLNTSSFVIDEDVRKELPIQNVRLLDAGDDAVARTLAYLPGAGIIPQNDGTIRVWNKMSGKEVTQINKIGAELGGRGHIEFVSNDYLRPREWHIFFPIDAEVRYDGTEPTSKSSTIAEIQDGRIVDNVIAIPDFTLKVNDIDMVQNTWVTFTDILNAYTSISLPSGSIVPDVDYQFLRRAIVPFIDWWSALGLLGDFDPDADWMARAAAFGTYFRLAWQINPKWNDRVASYKPYLVSISNPERGSRSHSPVYCDYFVKSTQRGILALKDRFAGDFWGMNVKAYPQAANGFIDKKTKPAPARVSILDPDQGIIGIDFRIDPFRLREGVMPGRIDPDTLPNADLSKPNNLIAFNQIGAGNKIPAALSGFKISFIITCTPAAPNNKNSLYKIVVKPKHIRNLLPKKARAGLSSGKGPIKEIYIDAEPARLRWDDRKAQVTERLFGVSFGKDGSRLPRPTDAELQALCINDKPQDQIARGQLSGSIRELAWAAAARDAGRHYDRFQGEAQVDINPGIRVDGALTSITYTLEPDGVLVTEIALPEGVEPISVFALLPEGTRNIVMKTANPDSSR